MSRHQRFGFTTETQTVSKTCRNDLFKNDDSPIEYFWPSPLLMSGKVEPLANNNGAAAPNWAYVPTTNTNVGPSRRTSGALRKRAARSSNVIGGIQDGGFGGGGSVLGSSRGELTTRQSAAILRRLNDLERDNHKDVNIPIVTTRGKDIVAKSK